MQVDVDFVDKLDNGWKVRLNVKLSADELSRLDHESVNTFKDFNISLDGSNLYFDCFLNTEEPWEDEPLEELLKAIKIEVEYHAKAFLEY